nr:lytic transglycosylase domain-containing protein [uncultured Cohaesibacter sp.]
MASSVSFNNSVKFQAAFEEASRTTGADFSFLLNTARRESNLNADAKAPTSSATGLFQFVEQTWLETMKESGPQLGYGNVAAQISQSGDKYYVRDPEVRQQILDMRNDPKVSALMAGAYAQSNKEQLTEALDRSPTQGELYAAHFLGANGGSKLISLKENAPNTSAADVFPAQAEANKNIFFDRQGNAKSVSEVYQDLVSTASSDASGETEDKKTLLGMLGLGNLFSAKENTKRLQLTRSPEVPAIQAQHVVDLQQAKSDTSVVSDSQESLEAFFSQPLQRALPSRYGLSYLPQNGVSSDVRSSRYATEGDGSSGVNEADANVIRNRVYSQFEDTVNTAESTEETVNALPRRKPAASSSSTSGDVYLNALGGALPKAKPSSSSTSSVSTTSNPLDLSRHETTQNGGPQRFGAMDLSAFLDDAVFSSRNKG